MRLPLGESNATCDAERTCRGVRQAAAALAILAGCAAVLAVAVSFQHQSDLQSVSGFPRLAGAPPWNERELEYDVAPQMYDTPNGHGWTSFWGQREVHGKAMPKRVVMCYTDWMQCDDKVLESAKGGGCNVIVWSFINFRRETSSDGIHGSVSVTGGPNVHCVQRIAASLSGAGWDVVHLASVGGWAQAHPDGITAAEAFDAFHEWNSQVVADPFGGFEGFDGVCVCVCVV